MATKVLLRLAVLVPAVVIIFQLAGCSIIGFGIGAAIDASKPKQVTIPDREVETVMPGTAIDILLKDGKLISGKYAGTGFLTEKEYADNYAKSHEQLRSEIILPELGDSINIVVVGTGRRQPAEFSGFYHQGIQIKFRIGPSTTVRSQLVPIDHFSSIVDSRGDVLEAEIVKKLIAEGKVPLVSAIIVQNKTGKETIAVDQVDQIQVPTKKHAALTGLLLGAVVDVIVIAGVISLGNSMEHLDF